MTALRLSGKISYGLLAFPLAFAGLPLYIHAPDFYAVEYGASLAFLGGALFVIRLFDALVDPFIGRMSDKFHHQRGLIMAAAGAVFAAAFAALYNPPPSVEIFWFVCSAFLATLSFSVLLINLNAVGALAAGDAAGKTSLSAWREGFGLAGLLTAMILPALLGDMPRYALAGAFCALLASAVFFVWYRSLSLRAPAGSAAQLPFRSLMTPDFRRFFAVYGISMLASSLPAVLFLFYVRDWLGAEDKAGLFLMIYFAAAIISVPLWQKAVKHFSPERVWMCGMGLSAAFLCAAAFIGPGDVQIYAAICLLTGIGFGAEIFLPPALLSRRIAGAGMDAHTSSYFGIYAFFMKMSLAAATALAFITLDIAGFKPAADSPDCGHAALVVLYAMIPAAIKLFAIFVLVKTEKNHETSSNHLHTGGQHAA